MKKRTQGNIRKGERMRAIISEQVGAIINFCSYQEFEADPFPYLDSAIMGAYIRNSVMTGMVIATVKSLSRVPGEREIKKAEQEYYEKM